VIWCADQPDYGGLDDVNLEAPVWEKRPQIAGLTLLDYAENYLVVFEVASDAEKTRYAVQLFDAADAVTVTQQV
jgi:hypothetical protein